MMDRYNPENRNRLSWWFPRLPDHIPTPDTRIIPYYGENLIGIFDDKTPDGLSDLINHVMVEGGDLGWPLFLRTDYLSGKHSWSKTCCVEDPDKVGAHICALVEQSFIADLMGFPVDCLIARKLIPTTAAFLAFDGNLPITKERRYFVQDAQVVCHHPYWPADAFVRRDGGCWVNEGIFPRWRKALCDMNAETTEEVDLLSRLSSDIGKELGGAWSVDWLWSEQEGQWYMIDMAEADKSYHWPGCDNSQ